MCCEEKEIVWFFSSGRWPFKDNNVIWEVYIQWTTYLHRDRWIWYTRLGAGFEVVIPLGASRLFFRMTRSLQVGNLPAPQSRNRNSSRLVAPSHNLLVELWKVWLSGITLYFELSIQISSVITIEPGFSLQSWRSWIMSTTRYNPPTRMAHDESSRNTGQSG